MKDVADKLDRGGEMSTPDARLSAAERAALADLEAAAAASDPRLASMLRGGTARRLRSDLRLVGFRLSRVATLVSGARWWGVPITVVGMFLMVLGLSSGIGWSFVGALAATVGLTILVRMIQLKLAGRGPGRGA